MGGNLLDIWGLPDKRLDKDEYLALAARLSAKVSETYPHKFHILQNYRSKPSFGDLDMMIEKNDSFNYKGWIKDVFGVEAHQNTEIFSFPFEGFQIDFILTLPENWETTKFYFYGETGNCEGRTFHKFGLKWGHDGLSYIVRQELFDASIQENSSHVCSTVILTKDPKEALEVGGFDYDWRVGGFEDAEELFQYIIQSKYFDREIFRFENLNHINRTRNRKRVVYAALVKYLEEHEPPSKHVFNENKSVYLDQWKERWPHLAEEIQRAKEDYYRTKSIKGKFNGNLVKEWLGTEDGKLIGKIVKYVKANFDIEKHDQKQLKDIVHFAVKHL